jgi:hypothetical protein
LLATKKNSSPSVKFDFLMQKLTKGKNNNVITLVPCAGKAKQTRL